MEIITVVIRAEGAAFDETPATEIGRILRDAATRIERDGMCDEPLKDINGNKVGYVDIRSA